MCLQMAVCVCVCMREIAAEKSKLCSNSRLILYRWSLAEKFQLFTSEKSRRKENYKIDTFFSRCFKRSYIVNSSSPTPHQLSYCIDERRHHVTPLVRMSFSLFDSCL